MGLYKHLSRLSSYFRAIKRVLEDANVHIPTACAYQRRAQHVLHTPLALCEMIKMEGENVLL